VSKAKHRKTSQIRAVKSVAKTREAEMEAIRREIGIMKGLDHPNIIKLYENFQDHRNVYLVMEQIFLAIHYMHSNKIAHRDLKPENFLLLAKTPIETCTIKVIDFGLSSRFGDGIVLKTKAGTPYYVAPEVLLGPNYDQLCDTWSCGVITYVLLCGYPPFWGDTDNEVLKKVKKGKFSFDDEDWRTISDGAKSLIRSLLAFDPKARYTAEQTLKHPWVKEHAPAAVNVPLQARQLQNLRTFRNQNKFKKAALQIIATQLGDDQIEVLRTMFKTLDKNGDGTLTLDELKTGVSKTLTDIPKDLKEIMQAIDADGSGQIDYTEFLAATMDKKTYVQEDLCWAAFRVFDRDNSGAITKHELAQVLGDSKVEGALGRSACAEVLAECDLNGDGQIDFEEFMSMMRNRTHTVKLDVEGAGHK